VETLERNERINFVAGKPKERDHLEYLCVNFVMMLETEDDGV
jgi:hypothetical protein